MGPLYNSIISRALSAELEDQVNRPDYRKLLEKLLSQKRLLLTTHLRPDDDGLGAELALSHLLVSHNRDSLIFNEEALDKSYAASLSPKWIEMIYDQHSVDYSLMHDRTVVILDNSNLERIGAPKDYILPDHSNLVVIDHHDGLPADQERYFIYPKASATCEIIAELYEAAAFEMPQDVAYLLYRGIVSDTGHFRYPKTSARTHQIAAALLAAGVEPAKVAEEAAQRWSVHRLYARRLLYNNFRVGGSGKVAYMTAKLKELQREGIQLDDFHEIINEILEVKQIKVAMILTERGRDRTKVSLRSRRNVDLLPVAEKFGGGGHPTACAAMIPTQLDVAVQCVLPLLEELVADQEAESPSPSS